MHQASPPHRLQPCRTPTPLLSQRKSRRECAQLYSSRRVPLLSQPCAKQHRKEQFYEHVHEQLRALLSDSTYWVSNLAQTSSLLYHSYAGTSLYGLNGTSPVVNWVGFYLQQNGEGDLIVGPYQGRPACAVIKAKAGRGVCADAFVGNKGVVVPNVDEYPGHIGERTRAASRRANT